MAAILTIDHGNTASKATLFCGNEIIARRRFDKLTLEGVAPLVEECNPVGIIYCAVGHLDARFVESLRLLPVRHVEVFTHATPVPVSIRYATPSTLGLDRISGAVAAAGYKTAALIADAGSALTLDIVDGEGTFCGGNISPGVAMRLNAMHAFTAALPQVEREGKTPIFGFDTHTAMRSGAVRGTAAEIDGAARRAVDAFGCTLLILTGGDAEMLAPMLAPPSGMEIMVDPDLIAKGLKTIFEYNENK